MLRILTVLVPLTACLPLCIAADEPSLVEQMSLSERASKINGDFSKAMALTGRDREVQAMVVGKRNEALMRLAVAAEAAKSPEHDELAKIYFILDRFADCARQARAAVKARPNDYASQQKLVLSLGHLEKSDEALAEIKAMIGREVAPEDANQYLSNTSFAVSALASLLTNKKQYPDAESILTKWEAKLDVLPLETEAQKSARDKSKRSLAPLYGRIEMPKKRDALLGQQYPPILDAVWLNGSALTPEELRGKVILIDFWAVWCGPCIATFPHLREWHDKYADKGLVIIGATNRYGFGWNPETHSIVRIDGLKPAEEDEAISEFVKWHELKHRIAVMPDRDLSTKYAVSGIPQAVLIDKQGIIRLILVGSNAASAKLLEQGIRDALDIKTETASK